MNTTKKVVTVGGSITTASAGRESGMDIVYFIVPFYIFVACGIQYLKIKIYEPRDRERVIPNFLSTVFAVGAMIMAYLSHINYCFGS